MIKIYIVDDNLLMLENLHLNISSILQMEKLQEYVEILKYHNPKLFIEKIGKVQISPNHIAIVDFIMPNINGIEMLEQCKSIQLQHTYIFSGAPDKVHAFMSTNSKYSKYKDIQIIKRDELNTLLEIVLEKIQKIIKIDKGFIA